MTATKILLSNVETIGVVSPYSYQTKPKTWDRATSIRQILWMGELRISRLTKGAGKGETTRYYIYFMENDFQHWVELTETAWKNLAADPKATLELVKRDAETAPTIAPSVVEPAKEIVEAIVEPEMAASKKRRVKREAVAA